MRMNRSLLAPSVVLLVTLTLSACGSQPQSPQNNTSGSTSSRATTAPAAQAAPTAAQPTQAAPEASPTTAAQPTVAAQPTTAAQGGELTIYSGRSDELVGPLIEQFEQQSGVDVEVRYGDTAELAATLLEEGDASPADVFFGQDAGALGAVAEQGLAAQLPEELLGRVNERFRAENNSWVGVSGRARVVVYNPELVQETDLPDSIFGFTEPRWKGKLGWAPTNGSFQAFVTALRELEGEERAREWLEGIKANEPKVYANNTAIVTAVASGEIEAGFVNHYYLFRQLKEKGESFQARNYYLQNGDPGALINVAGAAVLQTSDTPELAQQFVAFLLSEQAQQYFSEQTFEYPLVETVKPNPQLPALSDIQTPQIDLSTLEDLDGTLQLLQETGVL